MITIIALRTALLNFFIVHQIIWKWKSRWHSTLQQHLLRQLPYASLSHTQSFDITLLPLDHLLLRHVNVSKTSQRLTVHKFKVLDPKFFVQKSFNECEESYYPSCQIHESDTEKEDLLSKFKSFCQLYKQMLQEAVISEVHKICGFIFLRNSKKDGIFQTCPTVIEYITFCLSAKKLHTLNTGWDLFVGLENLDFNCVVDTFAKVKSRRK